MSLKSSAFQFQFGSADFVVKLSISSYHLELRTPFGTSHSQSSFRSNALITIRLESKDGALEGAGEVGLPPKKRGCYEANFYDIFAYFAAFGAFAVRKKEQVADGAVFSYDPFTGVPDKFFKPLRAAVAKHARFAFRCLCSQR